MPTKGSVFYDGVNIKNKDLSALRKQIGVVPQDVTLFNRSIKDNISLYSEDVDIERIHEVAKWRKYTMTFKICRWALIR